MIVGLIPARGGSKGIPKKNLSKLSDKNLIEIGIDKLLEAGCNNVCVSTENSEISEIALKSGAKLIFRPHEFATDESSTEEVIFHAIKYLNLNDDDLLVTHQITSPLIRVSSISACIDALKDLKINSATSILKEHPFIWQKIRKVHGSLVIIQGWLGLGAKILVRLELKQVAYMWLESEAY